MLTDFLLIKVVIIVLDFVKYFNSKTKMSMDSINWQKVKVITILAS
jgi:hypothetical protein